MKYVILFLLLTGCASQKIVDHLMTGVPPEAPIVVNEPLGNTDPEANVIRKQITDLAIADQCGTFTHGNRGKPNKGFMAGIALTYARAVCNPDDAGVKVASQPIGSASKDALALYGVKADDAQTRLQNLYSLMVGSGGRESSWRWCVGRDQSANNLDSNTCEAGLFQSSYNSRGFSSALPKLFAQFKASSAGCFAKEYKGTVTCSAADMRNYGTGEGLTFQRMSKDCPGFAAEWHAVMLRSEFHHYGPIKRKESLLLPACTAMFEKVRQVVAKNPSVCTIL